MIGREASRMGDGINGIRSAVGVEAKTSRSKFIRACQCTQNVDYRAHCFATRSDAISNANIVISPNATLDAHHRMV